MTRIAIVVNEAKFFVSHRLVLAQAARDAGYDVVVITPGGEGEDEILAAGFEWHRLRMTRSGTNPLAELRVIAQLYGLYRRLRPDLIHHVAMKPVVYGTPLARWLGIGAVVNAIPGMGYMFTGTRSLRSAFGQILYRACVHHPNMTLIVQNRDDDRTIARWLPHAERVLVEGSGVDMSDFAPAVLKPTDTIVMQTGRMLRDKGVLEFIAAAARVRQRHPGVRCVLVGNLDADNPSSIDEAALRRACDAGIVEWWGYRRDIPALLREASIFCLPSYREGLPKALIEAAAAGLALVTTDTTGCRAVVTHEHNGLLVPVMDADALAAAICRLLDDAPLRTRLGAAARTDAVARFSLPNVLAAQLGIYARRLGPALARGPRPAQASVDTRQVRD